MTSWETSNHKDELPDDWNVRRNTVLRAAGFRCVALDSMGKRCTERANQCDHIIPTSQGGTHEYDNLQALCAWHHTQKTQQEAAAARKPRAKRTRQPEAHPGLI